MKTECFGTLYKFELIKIFRNRVAVVTFLILLAYAFIQGEFEIRGNVTPEEMATYETVNGRVIDDDLIDELQAVSDDIGNISGDEGIAYKNLSEWVSDTVGYGTAFKDLDADTVYRKRDETILDAYGSSYLTQGEIDYWEAKEDEIEKPFVYHDTAVSSGILEGTSNYMIMMLLIIAVSLAGVYALETQRKTDPMIRASLNGGGKLYFAKILAGMTYTVACLAILVSAFISYVVIRWGTAGMDSAVQLYHPFAQLDMNMWELTRILIMLLIFGSMLISAFTLLISNITRNALASMAIVTGVHLTLFAASISIPISARFISQLLSLFPATLVSSRLVYEFRLVNVGRYLLCYQAAPLMYIVLTAVFIIAGYIVYIRHEIKSN